MTTQTLRASTQPLKGQRGSALVEAAIVIPVLVILLYWAIGMADIMVLRTKASEAARFALWETTVFRQQAEISKDVAQRFADLRSPADINLPYTGLMLYPQSSNMIWAASVNSQQKVSIGGKIRLPGGTGIGILDKFLNFLLGVITGSVDGATKFFQFNTNGAANVRVNLVRASHIGSSIFAGGEVLPGMNMDHSHTMQNFTFTSPVRGANGMQLVFDTWKAWPKPRAFQPIGSARTNTTVSPMQTYQTVEEQVSSQVSQVAFYGLKQIGFITTIDDFLGKVRSSGIANILFGGTIPSVIDTSRMDAGTRGPITIRPVDQPDAGFCPVYQPGGGMQQGSHRLGELASFGNPQYAPYPRTAMLDKEDGSRYTVPYKINSQYYTDNGGNDRNVTSIKRKALKPALASTNKYVATYQCRGHFFMGATNPGVTDQSKRYKNSCWR